MPINAAFHQEIILFFKESHYFSTSVAMTPLYTGRQCYGPIFCRMDYYPALLPLNESENDMAVKGIIIEELYCLWE